MKTQSCVDAAQSGEMWGILSRVPEAQRIFQLEESDRARAIEAVVAQSFADRSLRVSYHSGLDTVIRHSRRGRVPDFRPGGPQDFKSEALPAEVLLPMFAGAGGRSSHSGSLEVAVRVFTAPLTTARKGFVAKLRQEVGELRVAAEAIDYGSQELGPHSNQFPNLESVLNWLHQYFLDLKAQAPELPLVPLARSSAAGLLIAYHQRYPDTFDGLIVMGPLHPLIGLRESTDALVKSALEDSKREIKVDSVAWLSRLYAEMTWGELEDPLHGLPILSLVGQGDSQSSLSLRQEFARLADFHPLSRHIELPGGHHLLGSQNNPIDARPTYVAIYQFLGDLLHKGVVDLPAGRSI